MTNQNQLSMPVPGNQMFISSSKEKSVLIAVLLSLIVGPLGLFYASVIGGVTMTIIAILVFILARVTDSPFLMETGLIISWVISIVWSYNTSKKTIKDALRRIRFRNIESLAYKGLILVFAFSITIPLMIILLYIIKQGVLQVNWRFLTHVPAPVGEPGGGVANALLGSFLMVIMAAVIAIPIGILAGIYLAENRKSRLAWYSGLCVDILQGVPSIVVGIVVYFWIVKPWVFDVNLSFAHFQVHNKLGGTFSAISGSVALAIMMLPIVIRSTEETLKLLPDSLKEAALSLGVPYHRVILKVIVPCGFAGIMSGVMLSVARVVGETAPLLFTAFGNPYLSAAVNKPMESLPHLIFTYATSPYDDWHNLAWGASFILLVFVLVLNIITKVTTRRWKVQL